MAEKILLVDDDPNVLQSMQRQLRKRFEIETAGSGIEAIKILKEEGPFQVIVSDMRMPGMDGVQLLAQVKDMAPETVRIMLTGNTDQETAAGAVNTGQIFRFLTKPCPTAVLITSIALAVRQHKLITAEKELLNKTVKGSIAVMAELLSLANAAAFSSGYRIRPLVKDIVQTLQLSHPWMYEVAAMMSQIGCITLPDNVLHKLQAGAALLEEEREMYENHPKVGSQLIRKIPRLEKVAAMIEFQLRPFDTDHEGYPKDEEVVWGAEILKVVMDYDLLAQQDCDHQEIIRRMRRRGGKYNPAVLNILEKRKPREIHTKISSVSFKNVRPGMIAVDDVFAKNGTMLIPKNQEITWPIIQSLINFAKHIGIVEPIRVRMADGVDQDSLSFGI